jgi:hypothetical protein
MIWRQTPGADYQAGADNPSKKHGVINEDLWPHVDAHHTTA